MWMNINFVNFAPFRQPYAFTDSFIVSNPEQNYTVSELHYCNPLREKWLSQPSKRYFSIVGPQLDEGVFPTFVAKRQRI